VTPDQALILTKHKIREAKGKIVNKRGWFWVALHYIVMVVTFGGNRNFLEGYYTTIGPWVGVPKNWEKRSAESRQAVLEHELQHIKQCAWFGFGSPIVGLPVYTILYLLLPLPIGFAYFRWRFEREAYAHGINIKLQWEPHRRAELIDGAVLQMTSGKYGWTWPFKASVRRYFEKHVVIGSAAWKPLVTR
jgi:hypothetical protein